MTKKDFTADFADIKEMTDKIRSFDRLNESINFNDEYQEEENVPAEPVDEPVDGEVEVGLDGKMDSKEAEQKEIANQSEDPDSYISKIRELTLKGLLALSSEPQSPRYEILRQIFQYIDKANKKTKEEESAE
jgi:hypothetical protein